MLYLDASFLKAFVEDNLVLLVVAVLLDFTKGSYLFERGAQLGKGSLPFTFFDYFFIVIFEFCGK